MEQKDKDLLLRDLCSKLPYGLKCSFGVDDEVYVITGINPTCCGASEIQATHIKSGINADFRLSAIKPYLFPLSSMTEIQRKELNHLGWQFDNYEIHNDTGEIISDYYDVTLKSFVNHTDCSDLTNYLDANYIDHRGLLSKGLAKNATGLNIY